MSMNVDDDNEFILELFTSKSTSSQREILQMYVQCMSHYMQHIKRCERFNNKRKLNSVLLDSNMFWSRNTAAAFHWSHKRRCFYFPQIFAIGGETLEKNFMFAEAELPRDENENGNSGNSRWPEISLQQNIFYYVQKYSLQSRGLLRRIVSIDGGAEFSCGDYVMICPRSRTKELLSGTFAITHCIGVATFILLRPLQH